MDERLTALCDGFEDGQITEAEFHEGMVLLREKRDDEWRKANEPKDET